jgi:hypothetical protein
MGSDSRLADRNTASRERLRAIGDALSDQELATVIDEPWAAGALFAHMAFWDRFVLERWRLAQERDERTPASVDGGTMDRLNDALLRQWIAMPPRSSVEDCLDAASEIDRFLADLEPEVVTAVIDEGRERLADRSLHRGDHIATIETAFPSA